MKCERGFEHAGIRLRLTIQSEDGPTHSVMSDNVGIFNSVVDEVRAHAQDTLELFMKGTDLADQLEAKLKGA